jgi:hypothetical protein
MAAMFLTVGRNARETGVEGSTNAVQLLPPDAGGRGKEGPKLSPYDTCWTRRVDQLAPFIRIQVFSMLSPKWLTMTLAP